MTNRFYDKAVMAAMTTRPMNLLAGTIKVQLVDLALYTPDLANDEFLSAIPVGARIGAPVTLTGKSLVGRVFDGTDSSITGLSAPPTGEALVILEAKTGDSDSPLLIYIDSATGLPTAAGITQADIAWSNGSNKIGKL